MFSHRVPMGEERRQHNRLYFSNLYNLNSKSTTMNKSPNFTKGTRPKIGYIIHGTLGGYDGAVQWLCTPPEKRPVVSYSSAHYVIAKDGRMTQLVADNDVSWHCGNVSNPTQRALGLLPVVNGKILNPNQSFIGIELEWFVGQPITEAQFTAMQGIITKGGIKNPIILCHKEVTDYKSDFDQPTMTLILNRLGIQKDTSKLAPLLADLTGKLNAKNYKGAKDACSYLFTELTKLI